MKLRPHALEKPWGRAELPPQFAGLAGGRKIGEIWFEAPDGRELPLLVKYIFTSEKLSVQVHPDDEQARARGLPNGKTECWYILDAEPDASIALGFRERLDAAAMREAALDGSIERLLDWKPVHAGDFFYVPANIVHAIGPGISLIEVQQQSDVTYRLYDYGRPRELHLDEAICVARAEPYPRELATHLGGSEDRTLVAGPLFRVHHLVADGPVEALRDRDRWVLPLTGSVHASGQTGEPGDCLVVEAGEGFAATGRLLIAALP